MSKKISSIALIGGLVISIALNLFFFSGSNLFPKEYLLRIKSDFEVKNINIAGVSYGDIDEKISYETGYRPLNVSQIEIISSGWFIKLLKKTIAKLIGKKTQKLTLKITENSSSKHEKYLIAEENLGYTNSKTNEVKKIDNKGKKVENYFNIQLDDKKFNLLIEYEK